MVDTVVTTPLLVLPEMLDHFGTDQSAWIDAGSLLAGAMWAPLLGKGADIHGKRRVLIMTLITALVGALVCLIAPSLWVFIFGRLLQGAAVGAVFLTVALIRDMCAPDMAGTLVTSGFKRKNTHSIQGAPSPSPAPVAARRGRGRCSATRRGCGR
ncbi:MFS transporter [Streptomyces niphimycinicus]|uniref:MFS transporter n=1 Tax=Streptomyces niphimycinicus TaxID=2842201 RepID=UPI0027E4C42F|nr:MFS transporter [Streptomyces niphimycinicus]